MEHEPLSQRSFADWPTGRTAQAEGRPEHSMTVLQSLRSEVREQVVLRSANAGRQLTLVRSDEGASSERETEVFFRLGASRTLDPGVPVCLSGARF